MKTFISVLLTMSVAADPAYAASCDSKCGQFKREADAVKAKCGAMSGAEKQACFAQSDANYGQFAQYCDAKEIADSAKSKNRIAQTVFMVAGVACGLECLPFGPKGICQPAAMAAGLMDTVGGLFLKTEGSGTYSQLSGAISALKIGPGLDTLTGMNDIGMKSGAEKKFTGAACIQMGVMALVVTLKMKGMKDAAQTSSAACDGLHVLDGAITGNQPNAAAPFQDASTSGGRGSSGASTTGGAADRDGGAADLEKDLAQFPDGGVYQAATAGAGRDFLDNLPERGKFPDIVKARTGMSIGDIQKRLDSGEGPGSILGGLSGMPSNVAALLAQLDADATSGKLAFKGVAGTAYAQGGKAAPAKNTGSKTISFGDFGFGTKAAVGGAPKELSFGGERKPAALLGDDIWHTGFDGTIFDIVSRRLDTSRDKLQQLEWDSPLNRALTGLPKRKTASE